MADIVNKVYCRRPYLFCHVALTLEMLCYFVGSTAMKPSCWNTKGVSVTVLTSGGLKTIDSVGKMPLMGSRLQYTALLSTPACMGTNYA